MNDLNIPAEISPEVAAWMRVQMTIAAARAVEPLREEIDKVDDWANGIYAALYDVLPALLKRNKSMATNLRDRWSLIAAEYDLMQIEEMTHTPDGVAVGSLEARKMLYRTFESLGVWPK